MNITEGIYLKGIILYFPNISMYECKHFIEVPGMCVEQWKALPESVVNRVSIIFNAFRP
jgi:hypothetical protein